MSIRLYIDEDSMSRALARALRARNVDVTTALEEDMIEQPDSAHLDYATAQGRVLYSFNVGDFCRLHSEYLAQGKSHAGIIVSPQQRFSVGEQMMAGSHRHRRVHPSRRSVHQRDPHSRRNDRRQPGRRNDR